MNRKEASLALAQKQSLRSGMGIVRKPQLQRREDQTRFVAPMVTCM